LLADSSPCPSTERSRSQGAQARGKGPRCPGTGALAPISPGARRAPFTSQRCRTSNGGGVLHDRPNSVIKPADRRSARPRSVIRPWPRRHQFSDSWVKDLVLALVGLCNGLIVFIRSETGYCRIAILELASSRTSPTASLGSSYAFLRVLRLSCSNMAFELVSRASRTAARHWAGTTTSWSIATGGMTCGPRNAGGLLETKRIANMVDVFKLPIANHNTRSQLHTWAT
jgi:hypothetical protein